MLDINLLPTHIGIIMDGNGRWAKKRGMPRYFGHKKGADTFKKIVRHCNKLSIKYLTVYAFSTENWKRPQKEIDTIVDLLRDYLSDAQNYKSENVRTKFIGDLSVFDDDIRQKIAECEVESDGFTGLTLNIAINYGGQNEIVTAAKRLADLVKRGEISTDDINVDMFPNYLYTALQPPVDLVIRPSGEFRLSNFMIWQSAYAEFIFMDILWPDFNEANLEEALLEYTQRNRRFGGIQI